MQKWKWMVFLDVVGKLDDGEVNEDKCKHLERDVREHQGSACPTPPPGQSNLDRCTIPRTAPVTE